jgi:bifunctional DNA-binding transcriptional regulator/antitoxin component of YhaV-PrlF toxin-antitoxin module
MGALTITAKGQVTLRKELLTHLGVVPGDRVEVDMLPDGRVQIRAVKPTGKIAEVFGLLKREGGPRLSIEEINEVVAEGWAGKR